MDHYTDGNTLVIVPEERMDSITSAGVGEAIRECVRQYPGYSLCLDLDNLRYISSSGLRVLIALQKEQPGGLTLRNASPEVYEVLDMTGLTNLMTVRRKPRLLSVDGCEVIGKGAFGTVYRLNGDTVVKVFRDGRNSLPGIEKELANAKQAFMNGIPTAIPFDAVQVGDQYGMVFELIDAQNCNDLVRNNPAVLDELLPKYAALLKQLHSLEAPDGRLKNVKDSYLNYLKEITPRLDPPVAERMRELLEKLPDTKHMIHGDMHLKNVMASQGEMILIDMDHLSFGNAVFDFAGMFAPYIAFNEDDPEDSLRFLGIDDQTCRRIFWGTLEYYLQDMDEEARNAAMLKIQAAGWLRFLKILVIEQADIRTELKELQIRHAAEHLADLVFRIDGLAI